MEASFCNSASPLQRDSDIIRVSLSLKEQVPIQMLQAVMPVEQSVLHGNLLQPLHHEFGNLLELGFAGRNTSRVDVSTLESREQQFAWSCSVRMGTSEADRNLKEIQKPHGCRRGMIGSVVEKDDCV
jgi:hypothetical protein